MIQVVEITQVNTYRRRIRYTNAHTLGITIDAITILRHASAPKIESLDHRNRLKLKQYLY